MGRDSSDRRPTAMEQPDEVAFGDELRRIDQALEQATDLQEALDGVLRETLAIYDCDRAWLIYPCDPDAPTWHVPAERTRPEYPGAFALGQSFPVTPELAESFRQALSSEQPLRYHPEGELEVPDSARRFSTQSAMNAAIYPRAGKPWLCGLSQCSHARVWSERERGLLQAICRRLADALDGPPTDDPLRGSEQRYRRLVETMNDGVAVLGANGQITYANPRFAAMLGVPATALQGRTVVGFAFDLQSRSVFEELLAERRDDGGRRREVALAVEGGRKVTALVSPQPLFDQEGRFEGHLLVVTDITERKQAEEERERLTAIIERATDMIATATPDQRVNYINPAGLKMLGWSEGEAGERTIPEAHPLWAVEKLRDEGFPTAIREGVWRGETAMIGPDGQEIPVSQLIMAHRSSDGELAYLSTIIRDISDVREREKLEEQLRHSQKMQAIGQLAGGVAHDFNNIITGIAGYAELIQQVLSVNDPLYADVEEIRKASDRAKMLTNQLLVFSRRQIVDLRVLDLRDVITSSQNMLRRIIGEDVELTVYRPDDLWRVRADEGQVDQILVNLLANARDAMPRGGKIIIELSNVDIDEAYCRTHGDATEGPHVMLSVSDTGTGMDAATLPRIFEPFFTSKRKGEGAGLGLSTVYGIVKQCGGFINVYSEPDVGTTIKIFLPQVVEPIQQRQKEEASAGPRGSETILLVEDESMVRQLAHRVLQGHGYHVIEAREGNTASLLSERHEGQIHLLLTDVIMPQLNGPELFERLLKGRPGLRVLYMSGYTDNAIAHHGVLDAGTEFIHKPFSVDSLLRKVREVLDKPE